MPKKAPKIPNYKYISLKFADANINQIYIDYTKNTDVIMNALTELFKTELGEKFTDVHEAELCAHFVSKIETLNSAEIRSGYGSFQRVAFEDGTDIMPWVSIEKCEKKAA